MYESENFPLTMSNKYCRSRAGGNPERILSC
jgi:hypothetical protein